MIERVAEWARKERGWDVARLVSVDGRGSDWAGSTEGGFYDAFSVEIKYEDASGQTHWEEVAGADMESMWRFLMEI